MTIDVKWGERIDLAPGIWIRPIKGRRGAVAKVAIEAPPEVPVVRAEVAEGVRRG